jgi:carbohydrate-selective porin OprB
LATAFNKLNQDINGPGTRSWENVIEGYYAFGISNFMTLTPDFQFYINPGADLSRNTAFATSLRATLMF